jgi:hypothetical protein
MKCWFDLMTDTSHVSNLSSAALFLLMRLRDKDNKYIPPWRVRMLDDDDEAPQEVSADDQLRLATIAQPATHESELKVHFCAGNLAEVRRLDRILWECEKTIMQAFVEIGQSLLRLEKLVKSRDHFKDYLHSKYPDKNTRNQVLSIMKGVETAKTKPNLEFITNHGTPTRSFFMEVGKLKQKGLSKMVAVVNSVSSDESVAIHLTGSLVHNYRLNKLPVALICCLCNVWTDGDLHRCSWEECPLHICDNCLDDDCKEDEWTCTIKIHEDNQAAAKQTKCVNTHTCTDT